MSWRRPNPDDPEQIEHVAKAVAFYKRRPADEWRDYQGDAWFILRRVAKWWKPDGGASIKTYAANCAKGYAIDELRRATNSRRKPDGGFAPISELVLVDELPVLDRMEGRERIRRAGEVSGETMKLAARGFKMHEIAGIQNRPIGTVKSGLWKERETARRRLGT